MTSDSLLESSFPRFNLFLSNWQKPRILSPTSWRAFQKKPEFVYSANVASVSFVSRFLNTHIFLSTKEAKYKIGSVASRFKRANEYFLAFYNFRYSSFLEALRRESLFNDLRSHQFTNDQYKIVYNRRGLKGAHHYSWQTFWTILFTREALKQTPNFHWLFVFILSLSKNYRGIQKHETLLT